MSQRPGPSQRTTEGALTDGATRYLTIRADSLMQTFAASAEPMLTAMLSSFAESVYQNGMDSLRKYLAESDGNRENLVSIVTSMAAALGWGSWVISSAEGRLTLTVLNSPFAHGFGPAQRSVCAPIVGMFRAVAELMVNAPTRVVESQCAACGAPACRFTAVAEPVTGMTAA